jgi:hypothetical protein
VFHCGDFSCSPDDIERQISKRFCQMMSGGITVESEVEFTIRLPTTVDAPKEAAH